MKEEGGGKGKGLFAPLLPFPAHTGKRFCTFFCTFATLCAQLSRRQNKAAVLREQCLPTTPSFVDPRDDVGISFEYVVVVVVVV